MKTAIILLALAASVYGGVVPGSLDFSEVSTKEAKAKFTVEVRQSFLWMFSRHLCNGALIDGEYILTTAQCVIDKSWFSSLKVIVGSKSYGVRKVVTPETTKNIDNDIAIIRLSSTVSYSETVLPINLPFPSAEFSDKATLYKREQSGDVKAVTVSLRSRSDCTGAPGAITVEHICAGDNTNSAVKGDEGDVLAVPDGLVGDVLIGLVSFAKPEPAPAVFTAVSHYTDFILENLDE